MRILRKLASLVLAALFVLSALMPATAMAQEAETSLGGEMAVVLDWDVVLQVAENLPGFVPGRPAGNPGPLIEWLDRRSSTGKIEHKDSSEWIVNGPAIVWAGIYNHEVSKSVLDAGAEVVSCQGSTTRLGTCVLVVPSGKAITMYNTGAGVALKDFNGVMPRESKEILITNSRIGFPTQCVEAMTPSSITEMDAIAENAGPMSKAYGRDHFYAMYRLSVPAERSFLLWTTGTVHGGTLVAIDPGVAKIYLADTGIVIIQGSFQGVALCAPPEIAENDEPAGETSNNEVSDAGFVPLEEVLRMLESGASFEGYADRYPNAALLDPFTDNAAWFLLLGNQNPDDSVWMSVGEGGTGPYINYNPQGDVPDGYDVLVLDQPMDPECDLDYWLDEKPARCTAE